MNYYRHMNNAIIVFAGSGTRIHSDIPKQFIKVNDIELVVYTIRKFEENPHIDKIILVTSKDFVQLVESLVVKYEFKKIDKIVVGGKTRQESVRLGLEAAEFNNEDNVLIHDGDRPLVSNAIINNAILLLDEYDAVCPVLDKSEEIVEISNKGREALVGNKLVSIQTPQGFKFGLIKNAHQNGKNAVFNDDIGLVEGQIEVKYFDGEKENFKITEDIDLAYFKKILNL